MQVGEHMSRPVISVSPTTPAATAMKLIRDKHIRRLPVLEDGLLVGIVSERDLLRAMPSPATLLSVWEIPELLDRILVRDLMTRDVITVTADTPIQVAAQLMVDHKIGGLPVELPGGRLVGVITETDIFRVFCSMFASEPVATPA
ncbi:MAG TPA: CBS domain-containing protein [Candidatus Limnocylindrales bacterium]|nr:CBS domain-containing protein [Candidatus Limnocylindrales bacterium]